MKTLMILGILFALNSFADETNPDCDYCSKQHSDCVANIPEGLSPEDQTTETNRCQSELSECREKSGCQGDSHEENR